METCDGHCGYEFSWSPFRLLPLSGSSTYHNFHHRINVGNYGSFFTIWDTLCGTNKQYFKHLAKKEKEQLTAKVSTEFKRMKELQKEDSGFNKAKKNEPKSTRKVSFDDSKQKV